MLGGCPTILGLSTYGVKCGTGRLLLWIELEDGPATGGRRAIEDRHMQEKARMTHVS